MKRIFTLLIMSLLFTAKGQLLEEIHTFNSTNVQGVYNLQNELACYVAVTPLGAYEVYTPSFDYNGEIVFATVDTLTLTGAVQLTVDYFDADEGTVEYVLTYYSQTSGLRYSIVYTQLGEVIYLHQMNASTSLAYYNHQGEARAVQSDRENGLLTYYKVDNMVTATQAQKVGVPSSAFPNPAQAEVTLAFSALDAPYTLYVSNTEGAVVYTQELTAGTEQVALNTSGFVSGAYIYQLIGAGAVVESGGFVVLGE